MLDKSLSALAGPFKPFVDTAFSHAGRLDAERQAGQVPFQNQPNLMDDILNKTLDRLRGGTIDDPWWSNLLNRLGQRYIAPEFLNQLALQEWLADEHVADDLKALATALIVNRTGNDPGIRSRVAESYSNRTGEDPQLANRPIDVVVAVLAAGYIASVSPDQRAVVGFMQNISRHSDERFNDLKKNLPQAAADPITQKAHTEEADRALDEVLVLRTLVPLRARQNLENLRHRLGDGGDLFAASDSVKTKVHYWTARLCAGDAETRDRARQIRNELRETEPDMDLSIVDALLAESDGDIDRALYLLRDQDDRDSRTVLFSLLAHSRSESSAMDWYSDQAAPDDDQFFTAFGWKNWALCMARIGKWKEAAQRLLTFEPYWQRTPALAFVEGIINAAMLLPNDHRELAFEGAPLYQDIAPNLVEKAENYHSRARICFEFVEQSLEDIVDQDFTLFIVDWILWIRLMDPNTASGGVARNEISERMEEGAQAVKLILSAYVFNIPFNVEPLGRYLEHRKHLGGLNGQELLAECILHEKSMVPRDLVTYLEQHKTRLREVIPLALFVKVHVDALLKDGQTERARALVAEHATDLGGANANRFTVMIDDHEGNDPRKQLEVLYRNTNDLVDLKNLVSYLKTMDDRAALRPLVRDLFDRERTVENARDLVACFGGPSFFDHEAIIEFLETNADLLVRSDDLKAAKAQTLFQAGRLRESREINDILLGKRRNRDDFYLSVQIAISSGDWERVPAIIDREWSRRDSHSADTLMRFAYVAGQQGQISDRALQLARLAAEKAPDDPRILASAYWLHFQLGRDDEANSEWLKRALKLSSPGDDFLWSVNLRELAD